MNCKVCNTRLGGGEKHCPNCGTTVVGGKAGKRGSTKKRVSRLTPNASSATDLELDIDEIEALDDISGDLPGESSSSQSASTSSRSASTSSKMSSGTRRSTPAEPLARPDPDGVRALLAENPALLEDGMSVFRGAGGKAVGAGYSTDVGDIDLLATDAKGDLVVVMIAEKGQGEELIPEVLQRIGWVGKHLSKGKSKSKVRAIVLVEEAPESLNYAAAAVAGTVSFKTYQVSLSFQDLEI